MSRTDVRTNTRTVRTVRTLGIAVVCACAPVRSVRADFQCPDGSPPPCRAGARPAPSLALSDNTWLILPFENTARAQDAEVIRQASVPQLYSEMSRWTGIQVVSDDRVADLLQQLPSSQRERPGLEAARGLARRIGAGRLVLGGYLAAGGRASITARVYDTRSGREVRVVRDALSGYRAGAALDSLGASFARLARGILDLPEGAALSGGGTGTSSLEAYRSYVAGLDALNRLRLDSARIRFERALELDSNYAMPHLQLVRLSTDQAANTRHLQAALRVASSLPRRAQLKLEGAAAAFRNDREWICASAAELVSSDSSDADGWSLLAGCHFDPFVIVENGRPRLRGDLNRALRAAERSYALAPNSLFHVNTLVAILGRGSWMQCVQAGTGTCPPESNYRVSLLWEADSFVVRINPWRDVRHAPPDLAPAAIAAQRDRIERATAILERFALATNAWAFHLGVAQLAFASGNVARAASSIGRGTMTWTDTIGMNLTRYYKLRFEIALAREQPAEFRLWAESLFARSEASALGALPYRTMMGRFAESGDTALFNRQNAAWRPILAGVLPPDFDSVEAAILRRVQGPVREDFLQLTTLAAFHLRRTGPALDTAAVHPLKRFQAWFARGDLARARAALAEFDARILQRHVNTPDDGGWLFSAESHLELGDTATAWERMREFGRRWQSAFTGPTILETTSYQSATARLWGRAWLLYSDLAAARGQREEARRGYRMVTGLWQEADPVLHPLYDRARAALQQLGG